LRVTAVNIYEEPKRVAKVAGVEDEVNGKLSGSNLL